MLLHTSISGLFVSFALKKLGAIEVAINADFRGPSLERMINLTRSSLLITSSEFFEPLADLQPSLVHLRNLVVTDSYDEEELSFPGVESVGFTSIVPDREDQPDVQVRDTNACAVLFTYYGLPDYTLAVWRNLWFHTGDYGRLDSQGYLYYIARKKDVIRHRGENILPGRGRGSHSHSFCSRRMCSARRPR